MEPALEFSSLAGHGLEEEGLQHPSFYFFPPRTDESPTVYFSLTPLVQRRMLPREV
jgi:hypothetical protein